jgi:multidrug efflux pump subunit AcrA (membrane-fusion protein)
MIIAAGLIAFFWLRSLNAPPERTRLPPTPPFVETMVFDPSESRFEIRVGGNVVPRREVTISAEVSGTIVAKVDHLQGGRHVAQATPLVQIDPTSYDLVVEELSSELKQVAEDLRRIDVDTSGNAALVEIAESKLKLAAEELARAKSLFAKNVTAEADLNQVETSHLEARNVLRLLQNDRDLIPIRRKRLQAQLKLTELRQQQAQLNLDRTSIVAPFDGIISHDAVELGNFVQPGDVLLKIQETASFEIECSLRTDDLYWLWNSRQSQPLDDAGGDDHPDREIFEVPRVSATVTYTVGGQAFHWQGRLARYEGRGIDRTTRTVPCCVIVSEPKRNDAGDGPPALMRGMYVTVTLEAAPRMRLWQIPNRAMQPNGQVWTVESGRLRIHEVKPARVLPEGVLIRADQADLKPGARLVVSQLATAFAGMQVREAQPEGGSP